MKRAPIFLTAFVVATIALGSAAEAHTLQASATCSGVSWNASNYDPNQTNSINVSVNNVSVASSASFGSTSQGFKSFDQTIPNVWKVQVDAPGTQYDFTKTGTQSACQQPTTTTTVAPTTTSTTTTSTTSSTTSTTVAPTTTSSSTTSTVAPTTTSSSTTVASSTSTLPATTTTLPCQDQPPTDQPTPGCQSVTTSSVVTTTSQPSSSTTSSSQPQTTTSSSTTTGAPTASTTSSLPGATTTTKICLDPTTGQPKSCELAHTGSKQTFFLIGLLLILCGLAINYGRGYRKGWNQ